ncbi:MAG: YjbQ family protein [Oscillospiraceae bacterium]
MNTDGHLRSVFFGRSETMTIKDGVLDGGEFAHIYFIDWDHVRAHRQLNVTVMGTTEDVNDPQSTAARPSTPSASIPTKRKGSRRTLHPPARRESY